MDKQYFMHLEMKHLKPKNRRDMHVILNLMTSDYTEITASGNIYSYDDYLLMDQLDYEEKEYEILSYDISSVDKNTVLSIYELLDKKIGMKTCRSSLWVIDNGEWKLRFHQGTKI